MDETIQLTDEPVDPVVDAPAAEAPVESQPVEPDLETVIDRAVEAAVRRIEQRLADAEERGYRRAVDEARDRLEAARASEPSRTNFLASTRPDIWD